MVVFRPENLFLGGADHPQREDIFPPNFCLSPQKIPFRLHAWFKFELAAMVQTLLQIIDPTNYDWSN